MCDLGANSKMTARASETEVPQIIIIINHSNGAITTQPYHNMFNMFANIHQSTQQNINTTSTNMSHKHFVPLLIAFKGLILILYIANATRNIGMEITK